MNDTKAVEAKDTHSQTPPEEITKDPNTHLQEFLTENDYELSVDALSNKNPYLEGKGFVLTEKPLLVITVKKREDK